MRVAVGSMWRDSASYIDQSLQQFEGLTRLFGDVRFGFVENGSVDGTGDRLDEWALRANMLRHVVHVDDGCPYYPSDDRRERWRHLAWVANHTIDMIPDHADVFLYVESDLKWNPKELARLCEWANETQAAHAACNFKSDGRWYDIWGSRLDGVAFSASAPYHPSWCDAPFQVDSTCGALALPAKIARATRFHPDDCYVGWCRDIWSQDTPIWLQPDITVTHP